MAQTGHSIQIRTGLVGPVRIQPVREGTPTGVQFPVQRHSERGNLIGVDLIAENRR
jgi:hypothetical protein